MNSNPFPHHWQVMPLNDAVDALIDYRGKTPKKTDRGIPLVTAKIVKGGYLLPSTEYISENDYDAWMVRGLPEVGDIVVTTEAPLGEVAQLTDSNVALAQRIVTLRGAKDLLLNDYLLYVMQGSYVQEQLESRASGSTVKGIKQSELRKVLLPIPPLNEQRAIVSVLKSIDNKIQLNHQINQTLEQMAQAIFKSWFVDFEPVKSKMEAKKRWHALQPGNESASPVCFAEQPQPLPDLETCMNLAAMQAISGKTPEQLARMEREQPDQYARLRATAELFPSAMQPSELGDIPEGWEVVQVGDILQRLKPPKRYTKKQVLPSGKVPVFEQGSSILLGFHDNDPGFKASAKDPIFIFGDHTCITHLSCQDFDISQNVIPLKGNIRPTIWTYYAILGKQTFQEYRRHWSEFIIKPVILPSMALCQQFTTCITDSLLLMESLERENKQLENIRDTLLPKLLSGEITVPEAEAQLAKTGEVQA